MGGMRDITFVKQEKDWDILASLFEALWNLDIKNKTHDVEICKVYGTSCADEFTWRLVERIT